MTAQEIRGGVGVDPFMVRAWHSDAGDEWVIEWYATGEPPKQAALAAFRETEKGIDWTRFHVLEPFRNNGIYTQALRWSLSLDVEVTAMGFGVKADEWDGFKETDGGMKIDKRSAKARVKAR